MNSSRRDLLAQAAGLSGLAILSPRLNGKLRASDDEKVRLVDGKFPTQEEMWNGMTFMNALGPRYTANDGHRKLEQYLIDQLGSLGLEPARLSYKFPRWEPKKWGLRVHAGDGTVKAVPAAAYWGYSGKTGPEGVTGDLFYAGSSEKPNLSGDLVGKVILVDVTSGPWELSKEYPTVWGVFDSNGNSTFPSSINLNSRTPRTPGFRDLMDNVRKTGAIGLILAWTSVSEANAAYNVQPAGGKFLDFPGVWVGKRTGNELRRLATVETRITVILDADIIPDSTTQTLISTLPGKSPDEIIVVHTHTDGPNAAEENGPIALLALAKYFSRLPKSTRNRTIVFVFATGHMAEAYVSASAWIKQRPDIVSKAVAGITIEHLGCREWADDPTFTNYGPTGKYDWAFAFCPHKQSADIFLSALQGSGAGRVAVLDPNGRWHGIGGPLSQAGISEIGYIARPNYLWTAPPNGYLDKIDPMRLYEETKVFAKTIHLLDKTSTSVLRQGIGS